MASLANTGEPRWPGTSGYLSFAGMRVLKFAEPLQDAVRVPLWEPLSVSAECANDSVNILAERLHVARELLQFGIGHCLLLSLLCSYRT